VICGGLLGAWDNVMLCRALREGPDPELMRLPRVWRLIILGFFMPSETMGKSAKPVSLMKLKGMGFGRQVERGVSTGRRNNSTQ